MQQPRYHTYTELDLIQEAWNTQNACNLSGVVHAFSDAVTRLREILTDRAKHTDYNFSTKEINEHIICKLFASKIMSLSGELPLDLSTYGIKFNGEQQREPTSIRADDKNSR